MKPKLYETASFGKNNDLNRASHPLFNYHHFKFRYLSENVQTTSIDKTMEPIDLSLKRNSPEIESKDKQKIDDQKNEAKLLPYLLITNQNKPNEKQPANQTANREEADESFAEADLLKYNKKKLFLARIRKRKQSSSTDNSSSLSSSSSSNSPNSTPSSHLSHQPLNTLNTDRVTSSASSTNLTLSLSPNSDINYDLDTNPQSINDLSFNKKLGYFSEHYELNNRINGQSTNGQSSNGHLLNGNQLNDSNSSQDKQLNGKLTNGSKQANNNNHNITKQTNSSKLNFNYLRFINESLQKCNSKPTIIGLKRSRSELCLRDEKREHFFNLLAYKRRLLKRWRSESDLLLNRCNSDEQSTKNKESVRKVTNGKNENKNEQKTNGDENQRRANVEQHVDYRQAKVESKSSNETETKRQVYLRSYPNDELFNYNSTKQLMRPNQKSFYPFNHQFNQFDEFDQMKNSLTLNLQLNRSKASLTFNNSQFLNKKTLINGPCNKLNEKTGKRKFTKLASDEDDEDLEDEDENEENIIVDNLSNTASTSVSPSSIQSNSDSSLINKQILVKHHLDRHHIGHLNGHLTIDRHHLEPHHNETGGLDLRLPFLNHPSHLVSNHLNHNLARRPLPNKQSSFGKLPTDLLNNDLLQNDPTNLTSNSKDDLTSWKLYKDYYYLLLNQPDSPAKLNALQWIMKDLNEKNNNHINLNDEWSDVESVKLHAYKPPAYPIDNSPLNLTMFNNLNRSNNSNVFDQAHHRQLLNTSRSLDRQLDRQKFTANSPQPHNLANMQLTPDNYLQYVKMNENLINSNRHLSTPNQIQILTGQSYLNLDSSNNSHCLPPGTPNSFQDRKRISRPLTGRHVRQGTGASPTTLANLRSMIKERQKFRELNGSAGVNGKKFRKKRK